MNRVIQLLVVVVVAMGALQWIVPRLVSSAASRQLSHLDHGPRPSVAIEAVPFWRLLRGQFQDLVITANDARIQSLTVRRVHLVWLNGAVALLPLEKGRLVVTQAGFLTVTADISAGALSRLLARHGSIVHPVVSIAPSGVSLKGQLRLGAATVPLDTKGSLHASPNHQALIFHPKSVDGLNLPGLTNVSLFNLAAVKTPMHLVIEKVTLTENQLELTVGN